MLENVKDILIKAKKEKYAVGAFNTVNLETTKGILEAAKRKRSPVIVQITEKTMDYAGGREIFNIVKNYAEFYAPEIPVGIHLDHGKSFEVVQRAVEIGFTSVMYDGSRKKMEDNLMTTKKVVDFCHEKNVVVQAELGNVPYIGETDMREIDWDEYMTEPDQAQQFIEETGADSLAVAIGNAHGFFKERKEPDYERLSEISKRLHVPLVLHGASDWENGRVKEVISRGISCFNVDTASRIAFVNSLVKSVNSEENLYFDVRKILGRARDAVQETVEYKMEIFGSADKA